VALELLEWLGLSAVVVLVLAETIDFYEHPIKPAIGTPMIWSVLVRAYLTKQNRDALDAQAITYNGPDKTQRERATFLVFLNDGKLVTMYAPPNLIKNCFIDKPVLLNKRLYKMMRGIGWIGFTAHVITIGMSSLATQIVTVFLMVVPTVLTAFKIECDDSVIGSRLKAEISTTGQVGERR
jgi:hypothetical protein